MISCPTCARTNIDVSGLANMVVNATKDIKKSAKIAVMGCVVNGPGEASSCDFGVAGGKDKSAIFANTAYPNRQIFFFCNFIKFIQKFHNAPHNLSHLIPIFDGFYPIKQKIGIGSLLLDGIGDTIRVSLSDEPYKEVLTDIIVL